MDSLSNKYFNNFKYSDNKTIQKYGFSVFHCCLHFLSTGIRIPFTLKCIFSLLHYGHFAPPVKPIQITIGYNFDKQNENVEQLCYVLAVWKGERGKATSLGFGK